MGSDFKAIPLIDIGPLVEKIDDPGMAGDEGLLGVIRMLDDACKDAGFFYVKGHGIPESLLTEVRDVTRKFFHLPHEEKLKIKMTPQSGYRGYQRVGENVTKGKPDMHEAIDCYTPIEPGKYGALAKPMEGSNLWPDHPPNFDALLENYISLLRDLSRKIMRGIALALGAPLDAFEGGTAGDPFWVLRLIGYPVSADIPQEQRTDTGCGAHTDYGLLTLVNQDDDICALESYSFEDLLKKIARGFGIAVDVADMEMRSLELRNLAQRFIKKCNGLPIAIACIGRLLSQKHPVPAEWGNVYTELELQLAKNVMPDVDVVLKVSLEGLPYDLKNCFLHCALFPEDYPIKRRRVMRQWIAAGLITGNENKTLEEVAEGYLNELVNRSLLQVVKRNYMGRLKCCRVHDVIRLLALNKAGEECFGKVYDGSRELSVEPTRRISLNSENLDQLSRSGLTHLRTILVFKRYISIDLLKPLLTSSNLLSTLDLQGTRIQMLPAEVFNLFNLRYLGLRNTDIKSLPEEIRRLQNLEVLDAYNTQLSYLPNSVVKLQKLRYLFACTDGGGSEIKPFGGVKVPSGIHHLMSLHALQCVKASTEILREVGALTELRTFGVSDVKSEHSADLINAISKMSHLVHLEITSIGEDEVLQLEGLHLPLTLSKLGLEGQLEKASTTRVVSSLSRLHNLTWLQLSFSKMDEESFSRLSALRGLCFLQLLNSFEGESMHFSSGSFPKLRFLSVWDAPELSQVEIEEGALQSLVELVLVDCPELMFLPHGIEHLRALEKLNLIETSEELTEKLLQESEPNECNEDLMKIRHIKTIIVQLSREGIRERIRWSQDISAPRSRCEKVAKNLQ
uniref:Uncharacterized protein n=2 Tax=Avena sativa TaxID=4498 RepID=A0ACD6A7K2_AVESA